MADYGVRYGAELRKRARATDDSRRASYPCPKCSKESVRRISNSVWECRSCNAKFAGGAYSLTTPTGEVANRMLTEMKKKSKETKQ